MARKSTHIETGDWKVAIVRARSQALKHEEEDRQRHWKMRWVKIVGAVAGILLLATVIGIGVYEFESESVDRDNAQIVRTWELLRNPNVASGNAGQLAALQVLYLAGQDLSGLDLGCLGKGLKKQGSKKCIFLQEIDLASNGTANLKGADLSGADLRKAILSRADLSETNLSRAVLFVANLNAADLSMADLSGVNLSEANLSGVINLTQNQLDIACVSKDEKPPELPEGLESPKIICPSAN